MTEKLSDTARITMIEPLLKEGWKMVEGRDAITRDFKFADFTDALAWMVRVGIWAEKWNHHPEWSNVYNKITVTLTTHDADGLSALDAKLARKMDVLAGQ